MPKQESESRNVEFEQALNGRIQQLAEIEEAYSKVRSFNEEDFRYVIELAIEPWSDLELAHISQTRARDLAHWKVIELIINEALKVREKATVKELQAKWSNRSQSNVDRLYGFDLDKSKQKN